MGEGEGMRERGRVRDKEMTGWNAKTMTEVKGVRESKD